MKNHFKYSILIALFLIATMTIGAVFAQTVPIGKTVQSQPFESNPTANSKIAAGLTVTNPIGAYDGSFDFQTNIKPATTGAVTGLWYQVAAFTIPTSEPFTPGWVDIKIDYDIAHGTSDDTYTFQYQVAPSTAWINLMPATTAAFTKAVQPFAQIAEPNDGVWSWADVANLKVRSFYTRVGTTYVIAEMTMNIWEIWATVYPFPLPPSASPALSVMPPAVFGPSEGAGLLGTNNMFFVDVYAQGLTAMGAGLWGYQVTIKYDTTMVTALAWFTYAPFLTANPSAIDDVGGSVSVSYATFLGDTVGFTGDKTPLCRIYFQIDPGGGGKTSVLDLLDQRPTYITELKPIGLNAFVPPLYDASISSPSYLSFVGGIFPGGDPTGTAWHEDYPIFSRTWNVVAWTDNGDSTLSPSDQIRLMVGGVTHDYHVDQMTITIHWTFKTGGEGAADPEDPAIPPDFSVDPTGSRWHQIYPVYSLPFTITGWTDNGDTVFGPSDQFEITYDDATVAQAHLDSVTTNILVSEKPVPSIPEFPLGITAMMALAAAVPVVYIWRTKRRVIKK